MSIDINACGQFLSTNMALSAIDEALKAGYAKSALRWRVGYEQRRAIRRYLGTVADLGTLRRESETGSADDVGMFAGIPWVFDASAPDDQMILELIVTTEDVVRLTTLAIQSRG